MLYTFEEMVEKSARCPPGFGQQGHLLSAFPSAMGWTVSSAYLWLLLNGNYRIHCFKSLIYQCLQHTFFFF